MPISPLAEENLAGSVLKKRYRVGDQLGKGGMARVYSAMDTLLQRPCAIKVAIGKELSARLAREIHLGARLQVPGLVAIYDRGELSARHLTFAVFEYLDGETLGERVRRLGILPWTEAVGMAVEVASTVGAMHAAGVLHRDLKPENLFVCRSGAVRVLDLGVAWAGDCPPLTIPGSVVGSAPYMPVEQVATPEDLDERADEFALGMVLSYAIGGTKAVPQHDSFEPGKFAEAVRKRPRLADLAPGVPADVVRVTEKACAENRDDRYSSMAEFREALKKLLADHAEGKSRRERVRRAAWWGVVGAIVMGLVGWAGFMVGRQTCTVCVPSPASAASPTAAARATATSATGSAAPARPVAPKVTPTANGAANPSVSEGGAASSGSGSGSVNAPATPASNSPSPGLEKDMNRVVRAGITGMVVTTGAVTGVPNSAYGKQPQMCQVDSDCKKKEACKSAGSLGNWCAEYDPKGCAPSNYKFTKRSPDRLKGKCWIPGTIDGTDVGRLY